MPEHRIRLRGPWEVEPVGGAPARRVDLPTVWSDADADAGRPFRLARRFGRPRFDPAVESVELELGDIPGALAIFLNGRPIGPIPAAPPAADRPARIAVGALLAGRNTLQIEVDLAGVDRGPAWGAVALVIAGRPA